MILTRKLTLFKGFELLILQNKRKIERINVFFNKSSANCNISSPNTILLFGKTVQQKPNRINYMDREDRKFLNQLKTNTTTRQMKYREIP